MLKQTMNIQFTDNSKEGIEAMQKVAIRFLPVKSSLM